MPAQAEEEPAVHQLRTELAAALDQHTDQLQRTLGAAIRGDLSLEHGRKLQFEVDPWSFRITLCATEVEVMPDSWLVDTLPDDWLERAQAADVNADAMISDQLCPWFSHCWRESRGASAFGPAYLFFHGYHGQQFDLEHDRWLTSTEAFG